MPKPSTRQPMNQRRSRYEPYVKRPRIHCTIPSPYDRVSGYPCTPLPIALRHTLQLVLLLDSIRVAASLGSVDELFGQALGNALDVAESGLTGTDGQEGNGLVDAAEGRDIDGLTTDGTGGSDTGAVFAGTAVDDGVHGNLDGVLVGHDVDLVTVSVRISINSTVLYANLKRAF
jgi:hypothetical protein